ncbi:MAG: anthranilate phosphoribosyltransferase, partial [Candidatus Omnitrophica bacterium]|nr:anthranilate phosphoribosyltransferase [Candidatus Omnitrophota bacterium]
MIKELIGKVVEKKNLTEKETVQAMEEIMSGKSTPAQIAAFITALRMKGETVAEITGAAKVMREKATTLDLGEGIIVDTCGTGGDSSETFNISTAVALIAAGGGLLVAKHGNRSVSSKCGSADVMEALGLNLEVPPEKVAECIKKVGIGFLYAPLFHSAMKYATPVRREIGIRTIFNILGPLTNPANANVQLLGVYKPELTELLANVLKNLGVRSAFVVYGEGNLPASGGQGFDEITITGRTRISQLEREKIKTYYIQPEDFGLKRRNSEEIKGGTVEKNSQIILDILKGKKGAKRDVVLLNAAAVFVAAEKAENIAEGIKVVGKIIDSGKAREKLEALVKF